MKNRSHKPTKKQSKIDNLEIGFSFSLFFMPKARKNEPIPGFPRIPADPADPADPVHGLPLGTSRPHAPGVRMTVVLNKLPQIKYCIGTFNIQLTEYNHNL